MFAGVDTHKDTLAVAVIDHAGRWSGNWSSEPGQRLPRLPTWGSHNVVRVGVEGSGNFRWPAAIYLLERNLNVVEVPPAPPELLARCSPREVVDAVGRDEVVDASVGSNGDCRCGAMRGRLRRARILS